MFCHIESSLENSFCVQNHETLAKYTDLFVGTLTRLGVRPREIEPDGFGDDLTIVFAPPFGTEGFSENPPAGTSTVFCVPWLVFQWKHEAH